ncbi:MAG: hypothetical protein HZA31_00605 [Opitutae bacterium]|nr:hypothetical protein [Opitutae bacterium]
MHLPEESIGLLRDEAYLQLAIEALQGSLREVEMQKAHIESTRPPFGILATKRTRDIFEQSMRHSEATVTGIQRQLERAQHLLALTRSFLEPQIAHYVAKCSPVHRTAMTLHVTLKSYETESRHLPELTRALARDIRGVGEAYGAQESHQQLVPSLTALRVAAGRFDELGARLDNLSRQWRASTEGTIFEELRLPQCPLGPQLPWFEQLVRLGPGDAVQAAQCREVEARELLNCGLEQLSARLSATRDAIGSLETRYVHDYWERLREHAQAHYVEEKDLDEVLEDITRRRIDAEVLRKQTVYVTDPYAYER